MHRGRERGGSAERGELGWHQAQGVWEDGGSFKSNSFLHPPVLTWLLFLPIPRARPTPEAGPVLSRELSPPECLYNTPSSLRNGCFLLGMGLQHPWEWLTGPGRCGPPFHPHLISNSLSCSLLTYPIGLRTKPFPVPGPLHIQLYMSWTALPPHLSSSHISAHLSPLQIPSLTTLTFTNLSFSGFLIHLCVYCLMIPLEGAI